ncbi:MAG TPA: thiamine biosynthesis protein ThiS [Nitrospiraceae bacterium]|nr:thiamine biosynthesis protein ThiS [Nitrospiraceae bacterium]
MVIRLNGSVTEFEDGLTVEGLLKSMGIEPMRVAVEVNLEVIKKQNYKEHLLKDKDSVEIVSFIGGG